MQRHNFVTVILDEELGKARATGPSPAQRRTAVTCVTQTFAGECRIVAGMTTRTPARRLAEVAKKVGVSEATVSRVLNGKAGVSDSTREAVLTALDVLGYERPTQLRGQRARLIGLVLPELQNPIFPALAEVIGGALAQRGFTPVLCTRTAGGLSEADYVDMLLEQQASGVVFAGGHFAELAAPHDHYRLLHSRGVPVVLINAAVDNLDFPCVATDDLSAASQAFGHLTALGHERIGLVLGPEDHMPSRRKLAAFRDHAARAGLTVTPVEHALFSLEGGQAATTRMLREGVTGVICASDVLALGAIRAVRRTGLSVPGDVSVIGYDDSGWLNCTDPPLTTVRQPIEPMGKAAVALLVNQMETLVAHPEELLFEPELVVRGSTGPATVRPQAKVTAIS
jgi:DNA-binding LacI/PurR family transcriptional regulator